MVCQQHLAVLSDVEGLYTADPTHNASATHIPEVSTITPEIEATLSPILAERLAEVRATE